MPGADFADTFTAEGRRASKLERAEAFRAAEGAGAVPESYGHNSVKEALCLEYVAHFRTQFEDLFPARRKLYLVAPNECGVEKMVCTTLRPTQLPYKDLYDLESCANFLAHYLQYETLQTPTLPPPVLPSPTQVLAWGVGDSFDFSALLCSYLLGAGYDAYVVYGTAPRWICVRDQAHLACPILEREAAEAAAQLQEAAEAAAAKIAEGQETAAAGAAPAPADADGLSPRPETAEADPEAEGGAAGDPALAPAPVSVTTYRVEARGVRESTFLKDQAARRQHTEVVPVGDWDSESEADGDDEGRPPTAVPLTDPLAGQRIHAWVLVRGGKRGVTEHVFVEASTGAVRPVGDAPYLTVEAAWNEKNYWVNMQEPAAGVAGLSFDFANKGQWEFVLIDADDNPMRSPSAASLDDPADLGVLDAADHQRDARKEQILEEPPSWVDKLHIFRDDYELRYPPDGQRSILYRRAKLELFTPNRHSHGVVQRLTVFVDKRMTVVQEVRETFLHRRDKLHMRRRYPLESKVHEFFLPGRVAPQPALKERIEWYGRKRELLFYVEARLDGLYKRSVTMGAAIEEHFQGRGDRLSSLSIATVDRSMLEAQDRAASALFVLEANGMQQAAITKMTERYERDPSVENADVDVAKRTFYVRQGSMREQYHYADGRITRATKTFPTTLRAATAPGAPEPAAQHLQQLQGQVEVAAAAEKNCVKRVKDNLDETAKLLRQREEEETHIHIDLPIFDLARERRFSKSSQDPASSQQRLPSDQRRVDYLTPFLPQGFDGTEISAPLAQQARDACLRALKERLLERANIIQNRLNEEKEELAKRQAVFHRGQSADPQSERDFEDFCLKTTFRIQILDQRLTQHEDHALEKYKELDRMLAEDSRLRSLWG